MKRVNTTLAAIALAMSALPASAQMNSSLMTPGSGTGITLGNIENALRTTAAEVELVHAETGFASFGAVDGSGLKYIVEAVDCDAAPVRDGQGLNAAKGCNRLQVWLYFAGLKNAIDPAAMNYWNQEMYSQGYIDADSDPVIMMTLFAPYGLSAENIGVNLLAFAEEGKAFGGFLNTIAGQTAVSVSAGTGARGDTGSGHATGLGGGDASRQAVAFFPSLLPSDDTVTETVESTSGTPRTALHDGSLDGPKSKMFVIEAGFANIAP